jgi:hypothetical protein
VVDPRLDLVERQLWDHFGVKVIEAPVTVFLNQVEGELGRLAPVDMER